MSEKKFQFPSIRKGDPQNVIVLLGLWICAATVAIIVILNFSARKKNHSDIKRTEAHRIEIKNNTHRYSHHSSSIYAAGMMTKSSDGIND